MRRDEYELYYRRQNYVNCGIELYCKFHRTYDNIITRCYNNNNKKYKNYGARGIVLCDEWLKDRRTFIKWCADNCTELSLTIDRIDVNGNYEPNNCRWVSSKVNNKTTSIKVMYYGSEYCLFDLCKKLGCTINEYKRIYARIAYEGWDVCKAIETPIKTNNNNGSKGKLLAAYTYKGYTNSLRQICKKFNLSYDCIKSRVLKGMSVKDACDKGTTKPYTYVKRRSNLGGMTFEQY